ncbi:hypothetical protein ACHOLT_15345 [Desulfitobacterium sp. Sab5]|uniref:hypothetical protein n=1 Tax=Desulfitobacterium nosdiversum TaxID=3375356 RepID=UPI003CEDE195
MMDIKEVLSIRDDISKFLVHLTRDTDDGMSAKENLQSILEDGYVYAYNHHCLFSPALDKVDENFQKKFRTVCFTETPLDKICHLLEIDGRRIELKPYGLVFLKSKVIEKGGNPCFYTNGDHKGSIEEYLWKLFHVSKSGNFTDGFNQFGRLVNTFKEKHDFSWEREWRVFNKFAIKPENVFAIIAPDTELKVPKQYGSIPIINPYWDYEEIVYQLSIQLWEKVKIE